jgi:3-isopropylmalate dehydratase small subunit
VVNPWEPTDEIAQHRYNQIFEAYNECVKMLFHQPRQNYEYNFKKQANKILASARQFGC